MLLVMECPFHRALRRPAGGGLLYPFSLITGPSPCQRAHRRGVGEPELRARTVARQNTPLRATGEQRWVDLHGPHPLSRSPDVRPRTLRHRPRRRRRPFVDVEVDLGLGLQSFHIAGLLDGAVREARIRVKSAIENIGVAWPMRRVSLNLSPADLRKDGPTSTCPSRSASSPPASSSRRPRAAPEEVALFGELALDATLRPVRGVLPSPSARGTAAPPPSSSRPRTPPRPPNMWTARPIAWALTLGEFRPVVAGKDVGHDYHRVALRIFAR